MLKNKKGQMGLETVFYIMAFLFATAILIVVLGYSWGRISPNLETVINDALPDGETSYNITTVDSKVDGGINLFNLMFPFLILGLVIMAMIYAFSTNSTPIFFFISLIILGVVIILGVTFSNVYQQITTTTDLAATAESYSVMQIFLQNFPIIIVVIVVIVMVILFGVNRSGGTGGL